MKTSLVALAVAATLSATAAGAASYVVDAKANSSSGGTGLSTIAVTAGETIHVSAATTDLWSAGALPRWSNADGLTHDTFATGSDESGQPAGTQIGTNFGLWTENGLSAPYGSLVGAVGSEYKVLGTSFTGSFASSGTLKLYYWDSNFEDNAGTVTAAVTVPEPAAWAMFITGFGLVGFAARHRRASLAA